MTARPTDAWPGEGRRNPRPGETTWTVRAPLARWLREHAAEAGRARGRYRVLDVGCGPKPYYPFFAPWAESYVGVDIDNPGADLQGTVEALPVPDASFDIVLCTQVLEHAADPARAVRELRRVVAPGGLVLASTHGVYVYHPSPVDYWRWTHAGLEKLFRDNGEWAALDVTPSSGTTACLGMLLATYLDLALARVGARALSRFVVGGINRGAAALDRRVPELREARPGCLFANLHVEARA